MAGLSILPAGRQPYKRKLKRRMKNWLFIKKRQSLSEKEDCLSKKWDGLNNWADWITGKGRDAEWTTATV